MGSAYFITLDNPDPGFDPFVNGKAIAREAEGLSELAVSVGLKAPDAYVSLGTEEAAAMADEFGFGGEMPVPAELWFEADEGLAWVARLQEHVKSNPKLLRNADAVLADLDEYERVLSQAKNVGARWHLAVDF